MEMAGKMMSEVSGFELTVAATAKEAKATRRGIPLQSVIEKDYGMMHERKDIEGRNDLTVRYDILRIIFSSLLLRRSRMRAKKVCSQAHNLILRINDKGA